MRPDGKWLPEEVCFTRKVPKRLLLIVFSLLQEGKLRRENDRKENMRRDYLGSNYNSDEEKGHLAQGENNMGLQIAPSLVPIIFFSSFSMSSCVVSTQLFQHHV